MKEGQPKSFLEGAGRVSRDIGAVVGVIGLVANPILLSGFIVALGGEVLRRQGKKKNG